MNKSEVIQEVAGTAGVAKQDVEKVIDAFFDTVRSAVGKGDRVAWPSFGASPPPTARPAPAVTRAPATRCPSPRRVP